MKRSDPKINIFGDLCEATKPQIAPFCSEAEKVAMGEEKGRARLRAKRSPEGIFGGPQQYIVFITLAKEKKKTKGKKTFFPNSRTF